jgi:ABC-type uncharacterized transport system permease subunit
MLLLILLGHTLTYTGTALSISQLLALLLLMLMLLQLLLLPLLVPIRLNEQLTHTTRSNRLVLTMTTKMGLETLQTELEYTRDAIIRSPGNNLTTLP